MSKLYPLTDIHSLAKQANNVINYYSEQSLFWEASSSWNSPEIGRIFTTWRPIAMVVTPATGP